MDLGDLGVFITCLAFVLVIFTVILVLTYGVNDDIRYGEEYKKPYRKVIALAEILVVITAFVLMATGAIHLVAPFVE